MNTLNHGTPATHRILVLDDNHAIHEDFIKILLPPGPADHDIDQMMATVFGSKQERVRHAEFEIDCADQGQKGLALVERAIAEGRPYSMAFVDIRMPPGWDGVETISHLWACDPALQIVICTAYSDYSWQEIIGKTGNSDCLVILKKPFDNIEVLQLAHAMTRKWSVTRQAAAKLEDLNRMVHERTSALQIANLKLSAEIRERTAVQDSLRRSEERFAQAFNANPLPIAVLQQDGLVCTDVNAAFLRHIGTSRESIIGKSVLDVALVADSALRGDLTRGASIEFRDCGLRTLSGHIKSAQIWSEPLNISGVPHSLAIFQDTSSQKSMEDRMRHAQKMESVGLLAAGVAHDFNNIMTVIRGHASLRLQSEDLDRHVAASFTAVNEAANRAATLTRQLLAFSRKQAMQPRVIRLTNVIREITPMVRGLVPENIEVEFLVPDQLPPIYADVANIEQVIINLVANARDAMPIGGTLTIGAESLALDIEHVSKHPEARTGTYLRLTVQDTGTGVEESIRAKIFEPFFTTKPIGEGTGMGLATAYGIVKQHDGWIELASQHGEGSAFHVYLPVTYLPEPSEAMRQEPVLQAHEDAAPTILIVEDDPDVRALAREILVTCGYHVLDASDGPNGIAVSRGYPGTIHLLLTDMVMPGGLSGKDVAERLTRERPRMKVIFSSGYSFGLFGSDMQLHPGQMYLAKPYLSRELIDAVSRSLADQRPVTGN